MFTVRGEHQVAPILKILVMDDGRLKDRAVGTFYQTNIPSEKWTDNIRRAIEGFVFYYEDRPSENVRILLGSGTFQPGMHEIFYSGVK